MAERYTASRLRADLYRVLDRILETGRPVEIERKGRVLRIEAAGAGDRLDGLRAHPEAVRSGLEELVSVDWSSEWTP